MSDRLQPGETHVLTSQVTADRTALALAATGEALPDVFATPFMIAEMERACAALLARVMGQGDVSVGARIEVSHVAPTPIGSPVKATAIFTGQEGALYWFDVAAEDAAGVIGKGRIARAVVTGSALIAKAGARA